MTRTPDRSVFRENREAAEREAEHDRARRTEYALSVLHRGAVRRATCISRPRRRSPLLGAGLCRTQVGLARQGAEYRRNCQ